MLQSINYFFFDQHRENRLKQEKEQLQQQHQWLDNELRSKTSEVQSLRREKVKNDYF